MTNLVAVFVRIRLLFPRLKVNYMGILVISWVSQILLHLQGKVYHVHKVRGGVKWQIQVSCSDSIIATHEYMLRQDLTLGTR
jgi:hypothetical protein